MNRAISKQPWRAVTSGLVNDLIDLPRTRGTHARGRRVVCLLGAVWLISGFDLALTIMAYHQGPFRELNPIARRLLLAGGPAIFIYKASLLTIGSCLLFKQRERPLAEWGAWIVFICYAGLAVYWGNFYDTYADFAMAAQH